MAGTSAWLWIVLVLAGVAAGGLVGGVGASERGRVKTAVAETQAVELRRNLAEQKALLTEAESRLGDAFGAMAAEALAANNQGFLPLANEKLEAARRESDASLAARQQAI